MRAGERVAAGYTKRCGLIAAPAWLIVIALAAALVCLGAAPLLLPDSYDWIHNGVSESAAQGISGAWLARLGFVLFGLAVITLSLIVRTTWTVIATGAHLVFGISMLGVAAFSTRPWTPNVAFDRTEDQIHSVFATTMGFAFIGGVVAVMIVHLRRGATGWPGDVVALVVATSVPLAMSSEIWGVLQRCMFLTAALWYAREAATVSTRASA